MRTSALFENKPVFSFEVFPPRPNVPIESIYNTLDDLKDLNPDFISVTYGAGGSQPGASTAEICRRIQSEHNIPSIAHLPCINETKESVLQKLDDFRQKGIENILALRGDKNPELPPQNDFKYASDIIDFIAQNGDFDIAAACYPEGHPESPDLETDIAQTVIFITSVKSWFKKGSTSPLKPALCPLHQKNPSNEWFPFAVLLSQSVWQSLWHATAPTLRPLKQQDWNTL